MALMHQAELHPSKLELVSAWLPGRGWSGGSDAGWERVTSFRFDDPDGEVGMETIVLRTPGGALVQVPLTYRAAAVPGQEAFLVGTTEHSVLGTRWVYDAVGDPVYVAALATAILTGGTEAEEYLSVDGELVRRDPGVRVRGSGSDAVPALAGPVSVTDGGVATVISAAGLEIAVLRTLHPGTIAELPSGAHTLTANWAGSAEPVLLAHARPGSM